MRTPNYRLAHPDPVPGMLPFLKKNAVYLLLLCYAIIGMLTIQYFDGTGDDGDSIAHYLFAKYAPIHPELFFNHWAKPLFVVLSAPFAKFGFAGMKFFNLVVSILMFLLTYRTAVALGIRNALLTVVFLMFAPLYFILTFSGLTEPLFALFLIGAVYLTLQKEYLTSAFVVSFLPFIRSEGLLFLAVFGLYFIATKRIKFLPWLAVGHLLFSVAGYFVYHDFLWVFNKIPYAGFDHKYGSGPLLHFVFQLNYVIGVPLYILLTFGLISYVWKPKQSSEKVLPEEWYLVLTGFAIFFIAHTLFWYLGIFHSMGLKRVMLSIIPLIVIIELRGFNTISGLFQGKLHYFRQLIMILIITFIILFPFTRNPAAINWKIDLNPTNAQQVSNGIAAWFRENPAPSGAKILYFYPYLSVALNLDHFDSTQREDLSINKLNKLKPGDIIIWDSWFSVIEAHVTLEMLTKQPKLVRVIDFASKDEKQPIRFVIFRQE